jgi:hypothetical protein
MSIDTPGGVIDKFQQKILAVKSLNMSRLLTDLRVYKGIISCHTFGEFHHLTIPCPPEGDMEKFCDEMKKYLLKLGHESIVIKEITPMIEDCFMFLTGGGG